MKPLTDVHLADTSAVARAGQAAVASRLAPLLRAGLLATCTAVELEVLNSARDRRDYERLRGELALTYRRLSVDQAVLDRCAEVHAKLAARSQHRGIPVNDLIIAATAERAGVGLLHYDADFDRIAAVTGQPAEWVAPAGSIP